MADWSATCDILVIGSGAGGMTGAYTAARQGLNVMLVEATDRFGGMSAYSGGGMWFPCNAALKRSGDDDSMESARRYYRAVVGDRTPEALQDAYLQSGAQLIDYLEQDDRFRFMNFPWPDYYGLAQDARVTGRHIVHEPFAAEEMGSLKTMLRAALGEERRGTPAPDMMEGGQALIGRFLLALDAMPNASLQLESEMIALIHEDDRVTGAVVRGPRGEQRIKTRRGVLIAAGGFERNAAMRERYGVPGDVTGSMAPPGNSGRPIEAAMEIGADVDLMDQGWWSPGLIQPDGTASFTLGFDGGIFVDQTGARFTNETLPYDRAGRAIIDRVKAGELTLPFWLVYDDRDGGMPPIQYPNLPFDEPQRYRDAGAWRSAPTLPALAETIGVPAEALVATVARYNDHCARGEDPDFQRGVEPYERMFTEGRMPMAPITQAPFHAAAFSLSDLGTKGGLRTDPNARVLDRDGRPIPGLYAAGNSMAAVSGEAYPGGGNPIGSSMVFGHLAARDIAIAAGLWEAA